MGMSAPGGGPLTDEELYAYIETMMLLAIADGTVKDVELHVIQMAVVSYLENHPALGSMTRQELVDLCYNAAQRIYDEGAQRRLNEAARILDTSEKRMYALGMGVAVSTSDGVVHKTERDALRMIQVAFGLDEEQVKQAIDAFR
ncbi:MAG: tellurite resistance TerB family protein [Anaerolineae bacterium]|jgi:tellurite resistance protein|nr:tellurite resistance TerB family protein [Anaerolineae bacterium]